VGHGFRSVVSDWVYRRCCGPFVQAHLDSVIGRVGELAGRGLRHSGRSPGHPDSGGFRRGRTAIFDDVPTTNLRDIADSGGEPVTDGPFTAVVTGAASGIGLAMARALHARGARLILADIAPGALDAAATRFGATAVVTDVADPAAMHELAELAGPTRLVCLNAGVVGSHLGAPWEVPPQESDRLFAVNVGGVLNGLRAFVPAMLADGNPAHVLITASLAGLAVFPGGGVYGATKHAVTAIATHAAMFLADTPVRVTMICPALVATGMSADGIAASVVAEEALRATADGVFAVVDPMWRQAIHDQIGQIVAGHAPTPPAPSPDAVPAGDDRGAQSRP
jgi:NADP-dependent 3-hydroxy acid dehydrogenase YdfG